MDKLYLAGYVRRLHTRQTIRQSTVAEHTWGVLKHLYCMQPQLSRNLFVSALFHDVGEHDSGDLPADFMRQNPLVRQAVEAAQKDFLEEQLDRGLPHITRTECLLLEIADRLEFIDMCSLERSLGNTGLEKVFNTACLWINESLEKMRNINSTVYEEIHLYVRQQIVNAAGYYRPRQLQQHEETSGGRSNVSD